MVPPSASSSSNTSTPYKLPAAPLIARNLSTLLGNGASSTSGPSPPLPITSLRDLLTSSRPPLVGDATTNQVHEAEEDTLLIVDPLDLLLTTSSSSSLQQQLAAPQSRADLLDLAQGLALALARPKDGDSVAAAGATPTPGSRSDSSASASASAILSLVESRLLLASCYVVLALLPAAAAPAENGASQSNSSSKSNPTSRLAQATTQLDVARNELRDAQRRHQSQVKMKKKRTEASSSSSLAVDQAAGTPPDEDDVLFTQQLAQHQARLLLAAANVAHLAGRPEHEVKRLMGWWVKAVGQAGKGNGKGSGGGGTEGARGDKAEGARVEG